MNNKIYKNKKGITLIALIITIIVLLLLAGISISILSGQDGILIKASSAKKTTKEAEDYEGLTLAAQTVLTEGLGKVDLADEGALEKALGSNYNYLGEGIVEKDGKYYTVKEDGTVIKGGVKVGNIITYTPPQVTDVKWSAEYSGLKDAGTETDAVLNNTNSFKVTNWRVLSVEDGKVNLISENATTGRVFLGYANGYNNGVKLLNDVCNTLYGDASKGIEGRSIKIEDIEGLMTKEGLATEQSSDLGTSVMKYGLQSMRPYKNKNTYYPTIYTNEKLSVINEVKNETGLGVSEQNEYYKGMIQPETIEGVIPTINPYTTYWTCSHSNMKKYLGVTDDLTTSTNYELIMPKQDGTEYWVASRSIKAFEEYCYFHIRTVSRGAVSMNDPLASYNTYYDNGGYRPLRPVVSLSSDLLVRAEDGTWSVKE